MDEKNKTIFQAEVPYDNIVIYINGTIEKRTNYSISKSYTPEDGHSGSIESERNYWCAKIYNLPVVIYDNSEDYVKLRAIREVQYLFKNLLLHGQKLSSYLSAHGIIYSPIKEEKSESFFQGEILFRETIIDCGHRHNEASEAKDCLEGQLKTAIRYYVDWDAKIEEDKSSKKEWYSIPGW